VGRKVWKNGIGRKVKRKRWKDSKKNLVGGEEMKKYN
jgi:hypothetical protein